MQPLDKFSVQRLLPGPVGLTKQATVSIESVRDGSKFPIVCVEDPCDVWSHSKEYTHSVASARSSSRTS